VAGMILIIGGAYQGKLSYALKRFNLTESDVYFCSDGNTAMPPAKSDKSDKKIICGLDRWILALVREGMDAREWTERFMESCENAVVICDDISCGVVPVDAQLRQWREAAGRSLGVLAQNADEVVRLFCGIPTRIK